MNLYCVICSDLFTQSVEVFITKCGHMFHHHCLMNWLERKKTCPQCRNPTAEKHIHKVYFNVPDLDVTDNDVGSLLNKVSHLEFQNGQAKKEIKEFQQKVDAMKEANNELRMLVNELEDKERTYKSKILDLKHRLNFATEKYNESEKLHAEIAKLKDKIKNVEQVQMAIEGTRDDVTRLIKEENDPSNLALLVAMLKKSLVDANNQKMDTNSKLKKVENNASKLKSVYHELKTKHMDLKKEYQHLKINHERTKEYLKNKIIELKKEENSNTSAQVNDSSLHGIVLESPINFNRTPKHKLTEEKTVKEANKSMSGLAHPATETDTQTDKHAHLNFRNIDSFRIEKTSLSQPKNKYSIFKYQAICESTKVINKEVAYDGLGGSGKEDIFPSPKQHSTKFKRPKTTAEVLSIKKRKLAPISKK